MTLFFGYEDYCRCIAHPKTENELLDLISKFLKEREYKSYYTRNFMLTEHIKVYDIGSWGQFFYSAERNINIPESWDDKIDTIHYNISDVELMCDDSILW